MDNIVAEAVQEQESPATGDMLSPGPIDFMLEHCASLEEVLIVVLCVLPSKFRRAEVAQKTEVAGTTFVDPDDRSEDAPVVAELVKFAFDGPSLVGRCVVNNGAELLGSAMIGRVDSPLSDVAYLTRHSAVGVVVRGRSMWLEAHQVASSSEQGPSSARIYDGAG